MPRLEPVSPRRMELQMQRPLWRVPGFLLFVALNAGIGWAVVIMKGTR